MTFTYRLKKTLILFFETLVWSVCFVKSLVVKNVTKFTTNKKELLHDLIECSRVIPVRTTLPILSCTLIEATNKTITIRTTDLEQTIIVNHEAKTIEEGEIAIPFNKLFEIIQKESIKPIYNIKNNIFKFLSFKPKYKNFKSILMTNKNID